jgi:hypothetical protein
MMDMEYLHRIVGDAIKNPVRETAECTARTPGRLSKRRELSGQRAMCATTLRMRRSTAGAAAG